MINRDPRCVFVSNQMGAAVVTATWLTSNGLPAQVMNELTLGGLESLTAFVPAVSARGMEVWVDDLDQAETARRLLAEHEALLSQRAAAASQQGPLPVVCEECGKTSDWPANQKGTIQTCPHCSAYLDVESPESQDAWDEAAAAEGEEEEHTS